MKFLLVIFLGPLQLFAQDITGVWTGTLYSDSTQFIRYELAISEYNGKLSAYSHTIFVVDGVENIGVKSVKIKKVGDEFLLEDDKLIYNNYAEPPAKHIKTYSKLGISQNDTSMILSGPWKTNRTKDYHGIAGNIFLQKKMKIQETLIIAKLENLQLAGSLSFMTPQARPGDITAINIPRANGDKSQNETVGNTEEVVSNKPVPAYVESQQTTNQSKAGIQASEKALNKKDTSKEKTQIKNVQLPVEDIAIQKDKTINTIATGEALTKPGNPQNDPLQKTDKKIPEAILKKDHSTGSADTIKKVLLPLTEMSKPKNETATTVPIKTGAAQISKPVEADKKIPNKVEKKEERGVNKDIIKPAPSLITGTSAPKNELAINESAKSQPQQIDKQQEAGKIISAAGLNKVDSAVNKNVVKTTSSLTEMPATKNEPTNTGSIKPGTLQVNDQQKVVKGDSGLALKKEDSTGARPVKQAVSQAAAEIATRKIETIRSVDIKSDSLMLTLYDNGEIDGDTVSVLLNGKVIMPRQGLMSTAINKTIYLTPEMGDSIVLIMYAENLGSIPPNTGLLVIHDGDDIYEIRFTGDLKKNSSIVLNRKRKN